ncbi:MAG: cyclodeaminase [Spirochaetia bacterium]|jgi:ectoine utilization protein EutC|nr:cyclodeaminase [Spirochaetia bacterium]
MSGIHIISEKELRSLVKLDLEIVESVKVGFSELEKGNATVPPIMMIPVPEKSGEVDIKSAYIKGLDRLAVKVASGFFENSKLDLPSGSGLMLVLSSETGFLKAVLLDNGYLTHVRTGAAGSIAAEYLAPETVENVGVIGSGLQARYQMQGLFLKRKFSTIRMFSLDSDEVRDEYVRDLEKELGVKVIKAGSVEEVVKESSVVVTTTPARTGYINSEWLHSGLHITAMGSDTEVKQELYSSVFAKADIVSCDLKSQCFRLGELRSAVEDGVLSLDSPVVELGEFINKKNPGRTSDKQITVCDLTGVGVQDTMISLTAYDLALKNGIGTLLG